MSAIVTVQPIPEVLGVLLASVPGLEPCYLAFEPGLTVLYGLNGAGKTRTLDAISAIWAGRESGAQLVVRLPAPEVNDDPDGPDSLFVSDLQAAIMGAWLPTSQLGVRKPGMDLIEQAYGMAITHGIGREFLSNADPLVGPLDIDRWDAIRDELLEQRLFLIRGAGRVQGDARWIAEPLAMEEKRFPVLSAELRRTVDHKILLQQGDPAPYLELADMAAEDQFAHTVGFDIFPVAGPGGSSMGSLTFFEEGAFPCEWVGLELLSADPPSDSRLKELIAGNGSIWRFGEDLLKPGLSELSQNALAVITGLQDSANRRLESVLLDAPELSLRVRAVSHWWDGDPLVWEFGPSNLPLTAMSRAQLKWAQWAINEAIHGEQGRFEQSGRQRLPRPPSLLLLDEPEAALHRSAEANMAAALARVAAEPQRHVIAATHSPELLNLRSARLIQLRRQENGRSSLEPLAGADMTALQDLGLQPSDLIKSHLAFLLVEGEHDELVFKKMIGAELDRLRVEILPLRGARKLPGTIDSRLLFDFTDAQLFVVLDNIDKTEVDDVWSEAQAVYLANDAAVAGELLRGRLKGPSEEKAWLAQWLSRALEKKRDARVSPFGLSKADIIEYLPVESLVPGGHSWEALREEHRQVIEGAPRLKDFKDWLTRKHKAHINADSIAAAAATAPVPGEFMDLVSRIHAKTNTGSPGVPRG